MKHAFLFLCLMACCLLTTCTSDEVATPQLTDREVSVRAPGPSASGQAGIVIGDHVQNFTFHAKIDNSGNVSGSFQSKSPDQDIQAHGDITCLVIVGSNEAYMTGVITDFGLGENPVFIPSIGDEVWFKVVDSGEGNNSPPDQFSDWYWFGGNSAPCLNLQFSLIDIVTGNIQVKP